MNEKKLVLLPEAAYAKKQILFNSLWFGFFAILGVIVLMIILFPKFFLVLLPQYYRVLFQSGTAAYSFLFKTTSSLIFMFISAAGSRYIFLYGALKKKEITVTLNEKGIVSRSGIFSQRVLWSAFKGITKTDYPIRMRFPAGKLVVHSTFHLDKLRKKISEFRKSLG